MAVEIKIEKREKKKPSVLRSEGLIPATLYGPEIEAQDIQLNAKDFSKVNYHDYTHLIHLKDASDDHEALIKNIQRDYVTNEVLNIEFYKVKRGHKVTMKVELKFTGTSNAVKTGADLFVIHKEANIKCLPKDIPYFLEVDISRLEKVEDFITFADLEFDREKIELLEPPKEIVCKAEAKRVNVVETSAPAEASTEEAAAGTSDSAKSES